MEQATLSRYCGAAVTLQSISPLGIYQPKQRLPFSPPLHVVSYEIGPASVVGGRWVGAVRRNDTVFEIPERGVIGKRTVPDFPASRRLAAAPLLLETERITNSLDTIVDLMNHPITCDTSGTGTGGLERTWG